MRTRSTSEFIFGDALVGRAVFEERREAVEVEFEAVAVVAADGFVDQPERVVADLVAAEIQRAFAVILLGSQPPIGMIREKLRAEEVVAVVVVHAEREQRFAPAAAASASMTA